MEKMMNLVNGSWHLIMWRVKFKGERLLWNAYKFFNQQQIASVVQLDCVCLAGISRKRSRDDVEPSDVDDNDDDDDSVTTVTDLKGKWLLLILLFVDCR